MKKIIALVGMCLLLSACDAFFDKDNTPPPAKLNSFKESARPKLVWSTNTYASAGKNAVKLNLAIDGNRIYTAGYTGTIIAMDKTSGKVLWKTSANAYISAGPAARDGLVVVASPAGDVIAVNETDGKLLWRSKVSTEVLASPTIANGIVLVKAIDGQLAGLSATDGRLLWNYEQTEPSLILRGASAPQFYKNSAVVGFANGNLAKLTVREGSLLWLQTIAIPEGSFAIQRMVDIDADPIIVGSRVYAATYQGKIAALELTSGRNLWSQDISSYAGIAGDSDRVYISDAKSHVWAFDSTSGIVHWRQPELEWRTITGPALFENTVIVGDAEGYLHWLSKQDGHLIARTKVNSASIITNPVVDGNVVYVITQNGYLAAYTL